MEINLKIPREINTFSRASLTTMTWFWRYTIESAQRITKYIYWVEQELPTLPEHLSSPPIFSGVRVTRSFVLCVCFVDRCLTFCTFNFCHYVVCSSIYGFWLPLWHLQALLDNEEQTILHYVAQLKLSSLFDDIVRSILLHMFWQHRIRMMNYRQYGTEELIMANV